MNNINLKLSNNNNAQDDDFEDDQLLKCLKNNSKKTKNFNFSSDLFVNLIH